jgi:hypothetical protein
MYDNSHNKLNNCFTYRKYFQTRQLILSSSVMVYEKKSSMIYLNFIILYLKKFNPKLKILENTIVLDDLCIPKSNLRIPIYFSAL